MRSGGRRTGRVVVAVVAAGAFLAAGCGQYYGVHAAAVHDAAGSLSSPSGTHRNEPPGIAGDDGARGPGLDALSGDSSSTAPRSTAPANRRTGQTGGSRSGGTQPTPGVPTTVSAVLAAGVNYHSNVLPAGFPFVMCPVFGRYSYSDDYGAPRYAGGYHPHAGNDIFAALGTPVVAPFDGWVRKDPNTLGGQAVTVTGPLGYVYMAHLSAYAPSVPGPVRAGDVVGFVGNTGDARGTSPHDHFEWHPRVTHSYDRVLAGTNGAVDPFRYLVIVCPPG